MVILAITVLGHVLPNVTLFSTLAMYLFILAVFIDGYLMWRDSSGCSPNDCRAPRPKGC